MEEWGAGVGVVWGGVVMLVMRPRRGGMVCFERDHSTLLTHGWVLVGCIVI